MLHLTLILADLVVVASAGEDQQWEVVLTDMLTGKTDRKKWSNAEFGTIVALAIGGDDYSEPLSKLLYEVASPLVENIAHEICLIP